MSDPVSWLAIEPGWTVVAADGSEVGRVEEVFADKDIFGGLAVATAPLQNPRYVPAERVGTITEGRVQLVLSPDEVRRLGEHAS